MAFEQKDMTGALFRNDRKESDKHPDYRGTAMVEGVEMWVSGWINTSKAGNKYMALAFEVKAPPPERAQPDREETGEIGDDDNLPF